MERIVIDLNLIDEIENSGTSKISLVDVPAIEKDWRYFAKQNFIDPSAGESQSDYMKRCVPVQIDEGKETDQAVAICISTYESKMGKDQFFYDAFADYPWDECIDDQLAKDLSEESAKNICGWIKANMGKEVKVNMEINTGNLAPYTEQVNSPRKKKSVLGSEFDGEEIAYDAFGYKAEYFYICPGAIATFDHLKEMNLDEPTIGMARSAALAADKVFEIEKDVIEDQSATLEQLNQARMLIQDYKDIFKEIDKITGMTHDVNYMDGHGVTIEKYVGNVPIDKDRVLEYAKSCGFSAEDFTTNGMEFNAIPEGFNLELAKGYTVYKYQGPIGSDSRDFCRSMVNLDRFYTFEEIDAMGAMAVNPGFGLAGANTYSIWKYLGGPNCKHRWQKFYVTAEGTFQNKGPAPGLPGDPMIDRENNGYAFVAVADLKIGDAVSWKTADKNPRGRIREIVFGSKKVPGVDFVINGTPDNPGYIIEIYEKNNGKWEPTKQFVGRKADSILKNVELWRQMFVDESKRELVGPVAIPDMEIPRKAKDGSLFYVRFSKDVVKRMAEKFMREKRMEESNIQHNSDMDAGAYVFESWIVENQADKANDVYDLKVPVGTWMVKMRVKDANTWDKVKKGELRGFSLEGDFVTDEEYQAYLSDRKMYENLVSLINSYEN